MKKVWMGLRLRVTMYLLFIAVLALGVTGVSTASTIDCVSVNNAGESANAPSSGAFISGDGRYVAFSTQATNLDPERRKGIFVRDRQAHTTEYIGAGEICHGISADGRYILFAGKPSGKQPFSQLYLQDRMTQTTDLVSVNSTGKPIGLVTNCCSKTGSRPGTAALSADGRYVIFLSPNPKNVSSDPNTSYVSGLPFVHDRQTGKTVCIDKAGSNCHGVAIGGENPIALIKSDGKSLTAESTGLGVYAIDVTTGKAARVSVDTTGDPTGCVLSISADGRFVCFVASKRRPSDEVRSSSRPYLSDIYLHDRVHGITDHVSASGEIEQGSASFGSVSANGRYVAFIASVSIPSSEVGDKAQPPHTTFESRVFLYDRITQTTERLGVSEGGYGFPSAPTVSADGRFVAYVGTFAGSTSLDSRSQVLIYDRGESTMTSHHTVTPTPMQWEYRVVSLAQSDESLQQQLNDLGREGFRIVAAPSQSNGSGRLILERPLAREGHFIEQSLPER